MAKLQTTAINTNKQVWKCLMCTWLPVTEPVTQTEPNSQQTKKNLPWQFWQSQSAVFSGVKDAARTSTCQRPTKSDPHPVWRATQWDWHRREKLKAKSSFLIPSNSIRSHSKPKHLSQTPHLIASLQLVFISKLAKAVFFQEPFYLTSAEKVVPA